MSNRVAPARQVAFDLLLELRNKPQLHSDDLLRSRRADALLPVDRNLLTALVMGVLRWKIALDSRIASVLTGTVELDPPVEIALELGAVQLLLMDRIPAHTAIFESVEFIKQSGNIRAAGLVNAVLRKLIHAPKLMAPDMPLHSAEEIARTWAHPLWLVSRWIRAFGVASASMICRFDQLPPPTTIRLLDPRAEAALREEGVVLEAGAFVKKARRVLKGDVSSTRTFSQGLVRIQDEGSQLIAEIAGRGGMAFSSAPVAILDCCAAPGGKTAILAEINPQAPITACEIHPDRLKAMRSFLRRHREQIDFRLADTSRIRFEGQFDLVLCDVPCSGTGTLARNPEIRHKLLPADLLRQQERQVGILMSAMNALSPGGQLVYSTCSLEREENASVVRRALEGRKNLHLVSFKERVQILENEGALLEGSVEILFPQGSSPQFLRTIPGVHACDGFFGAVIVRDR